ncbi:unnamed protein product [Withania somnifera]
MMHNLYGQIDLATSAEYRAEEVQSRLSNKYPSFLKPMIRSNASGGFWLVDESQEEYITKYLAERNGLSGGWRGFSLAHDLVDGDVIVFQLFRFCKLKIRIRKPSFCILVYIANYLAEVDAALVLLHLDVHQKQIDPVKNFPHKKGIIILQKNILHKHSHPMNTLKELNLPSKGLDYETLSIVDAVKAGKLDDNPSGFSSWKTRPTKTEQLEIRPISGGYSIDTTLTLSLPNVVFWL